MGTAQIDAMPFGCGVCWFYRAGLDGVRTSLLHACGSNKAERRTAFAFKAKGKEVASRSISQGVVVSCLISDGRGTKIVTLCGTADA